MQNFQILDAGLVCEDGAAVRFEIEYEYPKWFGSEFQWRAERGTISAGMELCFDALNKGDNEKWVRYACGTCELREQSWHLQPDANAGRTMPLGEWVAERVFQEGYAGAAEKIISYISKL